MRSSASTIRCFVALWPDESARNRLDELGQRWHERFPTARRMRRANFHLTLAFIGEIDAASARLVAARLAQQTWQPSLWRVDRIGVFDRARVLWAGSGDEPELAAIAARVRTLLDELQVRYDRKPFAPHVTLLRNLPRLAFGTSEGIDTPVDWPVQRAVLLQSTHDETGTRYTALEPSGDPGPGSAR